MRSGSTHACSAASAGACSHAAARARKWSIYSCSPFGSCKATDPAATHLLAYLGDGACSLRWEGDSASRSLHHTTVVKRECEGVIAITLHPNPSRSKHETRALQPGLRTDQTRTCVLHTRVTDSEVAARSCADPRGSSRRERPRSDPRLLCERTACSRQGSILRAPAALPHGRFHFRDQGVEFTFWGGFTGGVSPTHRRCYDLGGHRVHHKW